jgi:hypothetical protein
MDGALQLDSAAVSTTADLALGERGEPAPELKHCCPGSPRKGCGRNLHRLCAASRSWAQPRCIMFCGIVSRRIDGWIIGSHNGLWNRR